MLNRNKQEALLVSLDAEKAFDSLSWKFLQVTLQHIGIKGPFATAIRSLYSTPSTLVKLHSSSSTAFSIRNGTHQGCPLSPLLFAICIEPFAAHIRLHPDISGVSVATKQYKLALYADDVIFTITNPSTSLSNLISEIYNYSHLSGYKLNSNKTEILPLNVTQDNLN